MTNNNSNEWRHLVVIGGGAAGFFCGVNVAALESKLHVTILEKSEKLLSKVRISGGGRCNVTHACFSIPALVRNYPRGANFLKKPFLEFFTKNTIQWFEDKGVVLKAEADGRMFPVTDSSETIIECLLDEAKKHNVTIRLRSNVRNISPVKNEEGDQFQIDLQDGTSLLCDYVCIATGGFPKLSQFQWIEALGHHITEPVPSLFTFNVPDSNIKNLMGVSVQNALIKIKGTSFSQHGPLLITHWGFSGPAVLKLSSFAARELASMNYNFSILISWLGDTNENRILERLRKIRLESGKKNMINKNPFGLPARLWEYHLDAAFISPETKWASLPSKQQNLLAKNLSSQEFFVKGKTTFKDEFVTAGGIVLHEISSATMESKMIPGLFFAGEIMDVDGITGGFNFQHAWTSGFIAARSIATKVSHGRDLRRQSGHLT